MRGLLSKFRAVVLCAAVVVAACLPAVATEWLLQDRLPPPAASPTMSEDFDFAHEEFDIRGNEIVRPVERYGVDPRGSLYELHSPHTEIPRLAPPEL